MRHGKFLEALMTQHHPPKERLSIATLEGPALWKALGFKNARAFQRAIETGRIGIPLYPMPGQSRGWFARVEDVATHRASSAPAKGISEGQSPGSRSPVPEAPRNAAAPSESAMYCAEPSASLPAKDPSSDD